MLSEYLGRCLVDSELAECGYAQSGYESILRFSTWRDQKCSERTVDKKQCLVFEMTDSRKYNGYPVISGFAADSLGDMVDQVKQYLDDLMSVINEPLRECEHCHGTGHVLIEKEKTR